MRDDQAAVATIPTPVVSTSTSCPRREQLRRGPSWLERCVTAASSGSISAAVAATMSMRTERILFLRSVVEPTDQIADIGVRSAIFLRSDVVDHLLMRWRTPRHRSCREVVLLCEDLDARSLAVDVNSVADVEAGARLSGSRLSELSSDFCEINR